MHTAGQKKKATLVSLDLNLRAALTPELLGLLLGRWGGRGRGVSLHHTQDPLKKRNSEGAVYFKYLRQGEERLLERVESL